MKRNDRQTKYVSSRNSVPLKISRNSGSSATGKPEFKPKGATKLGGPGEHWLTVSQWDLAILHIWLVLEGPDFWLTLGVYTATDSVPM
jgi:hypothetical protein